VKYRFHLAKLEQCVWLPITIQPALNVHLGPLHQELQETSVIKTLTVFPQNVKILYVKAVLKDNHVANRLIVELLSTVSPKPHPASPVLPPEAPATPITNA